MCIAAVMVTCGDGVKSLQDDSPMYCVIVVIMGNGGTKFQNDFSHGYSAATDITCCGGAKPQ